MADLTNTILEAVKNGVCKIISDVTDIVQKEKCFKEGEKAEEAALDPEKTEPEKEV